MSDSKVKTFFRILTLAGKGGHSVSFRRAHAEPRGEGFFTWMPDLIRRGCSRCCAEWYELPLDAVKAES